MPSRQIKIIDFLSRGPRISRATNSAKKKKNNNNNNDARNRKEKKKHEFLPITRVVYRGWFSKVGPKNNNNNNSSF